MANIKNFGLSGVGANVQFGKGGAKLVQADGSFSAKTADNAAFVRFAIANAVDAADAVTLQQMEAAVSAASGENQLLQQEVDNTQAGAGLAIDGSYVASQHAILAGANSLAEADDALAAAVAAEALAREGADQELGNAVSGLEGRVDTAEGEIDNLEANALAQQEAIDALAGRIDSLEGDSADERLEALESNVAIAQGDIEGLEANAAAQQGEIDALAGRMGQAELDIDAAEQAHADLLANAIVRDGSVAMTAALNLANNAIINVAAPVNGTDAANKTYVDSKVSNLGNAFNYVRLLAGGETAETAFDLATLEEDEKNVGDYYKVTAGWFKLGAQSVAAYFNDNDGIVFNTDGGFDKIDNTNSVSRGTAGEIVVEGNADTGFDISIDGAYTLARQQEVADEADAREQADLELSNSIDALELLVEANAAAQQEALDALGDRIDSLEGDSADARLTALESNVAIAQGDIDALEANAVAQQGDIDALEANAVEQQLAIDAAAGRLDDLEANAVAQQGDIDALEANAVAQQQAIDALTDGLTNLSSDTIVSAGEVYSVTATDDDIAIVSADASSSLSITAADGEVVMTVVDADNADADLRLVAQGAGQVIIGDEGVGVVQADDGYDMIVSGGIGGGNLLLKGAEVSIQDEDGTSVATFISGGSSELDIATTDNSVSFTAGGAAADVDLIFAPKGEGSVDMSGAKVVNVADGVDATDAVNKGQLDALANAVAASEAGHVMTSVATIAAADGAVTLADAVTGVVTRIRVVILTAYNSGAALVVGTTAAPSDLVASADVDEMAPGIYVIETAKEYSAADLKVTLSGATAGSAKVYLEYIKG